MACSFPAHPNWLTQRSFATDIVADTRHRRGAVVARLRERADVRVRARALKVGDYLINDTVIVVHKTLDELASALLADLLYAEAARLRQARWRPALIVEGSHYGPVLPRHAIASAIVRLSLVFDVPVLRTRDPDDSAAMLLYCGM